MVACGALFSEEVTVLDLKVLTSQDEDSASPAVERPAVLSVLSEYVYNSYLAIFK